MIPCRRYPKDGSNIARYFSDMSGGFEVVPDPTAQARPAPFASRSVRRALLNATGQFRVILSLR